MKLLSYGKHHTSDATKSNEQHSTRGKYMPSDRVQKKIRVDYAENTPDYVEILTVDKIDNIKPFQCIEQQWNGKHFKVLPAV